MPGTIVKLSSVDARAWAYNQPVWLDADGETIRNVTKEEQGAISRALERSKKVNQSFRLDLPLLPVGGQRHLRQVGGKKAPIETAVFAFEVSFVGKKRVVTVFRGDLRYATGREVLAARLLAEHGECVLHGRNGKCLTVLRDPLIAERAPNMGPRVQRSQSPEERARLDVERTTVARGSVVTTKRKPQARHAVTLTARVFSPKQCPNDCRGYRSGGSGWTLANVKGRMPGENEHHPMCVNAAAWARTQKAPDNDYVLYDLELSKVMREADESEVSEARAQEQKLGAMQLTLNGRVYAVLTRSDAEQAFAEARGEAVPAVDGPATERPLAPTPDYRSEAADDAEAAQDWSSSDLGEGESEEEDEGAPAAGSQVTAVPGTSTSGERDQWPTLDQLSPSEHYRQRSEVTVRDYLSRRTATAQGSRA